MRRAPPSLDADETVALNTLALALELTDLFGAPSRFDQREATLWGLVAKETEAAERSTDALLALVAEAMDRWRCSGTG